MSIISGLLDYLGELEEHVAGGNAAAIGAPPKTFSVTVGEAQNGIADLCDILTALSHKLADANADEKALIDIAQLAGDVGVPYTAEAIAVIQLLFLVMAHNQSAKPGAQLGPFAGGGNPRGSNNVTPGS